MKSKNHFICQTIKAEYDAKCIGFIMSVWIFTARGIWLNFCLDEWFYIFQLV